MSKERGIVEEWNIGMMSVFGNIHADISPVWFVIPGLTNLAPYLIRGNPVFSWIPAQASPRRAFAGMTTFGVVNVAVRKFSFIYPLFHYSSIPLFQTLWILTLT
jgi:hypothetical protein